VSALPSTAQSVTRAGRRARLGSENWSGRQTRRMDGCCWRAAQPLTSTEGSTRCRPASRSRSRTKRVHTGEPPRRVRSSVHCVENTNRAARASSHLCCETPRPNAPWSCPMRTHLSTQWRHLLRGCTSTSPGRSGPMGGRTDLAGSRR